MTDTNEADPTLAAFGNRLRQLRSSKGYSQEGFALEAGLNRSYIGDAERGLRNVSFKNIKKITKTLGITLSEFFEGMG